MNPRWTRRRERRSRLETPSQTQKISRTILPWTKDMYYKPPPSTKSRASSYIFPSSRQLANPQIPPQNQPNPLPPPQNKPRLEKIRPEKKIPSKKNLNSKQKVTLETFKTREQEKEKISCGNLRYIYSPTKPPPLWLVVALGSTGKNH